MSDLNRNTVPQMKALLDHHPDIIPEHRYKEFGVMEMLAQNNITASEHVISVLSIARWRATTMKNKAMYTGIDLNPHDKQPASDQALEQTENNM